MNDSSQSPVKFVTIFTNLFYLDCVAINAPHINMDSQLMAVNRAIVTKADQRDSNAILSASVHVMIMLKADDATDAKKINIIVIKDAWIVLIVIIWYSMRPMIIAEN